MPDVCLSPPTPPAGPLPIPYPNFSDASKTDGGTKSVKIGGKGIGLKNQSTYKKSTGNAAATRNFGMGIVSHKLEGKTKHAAWSFDVKFENKNVIRNMDITTHNHVNQSNVALTLDAANFMPAGEGDDDCDAMAAREEAARTSSDAPTAVNKPKTTNSVGHYQLPTPSTSSYNMIACSKDVGFVANSAYSEGVGKSETETFQRKNMKEPKPAEAASNLCDGYQHKSPNNCSASTHTEARMIEEIFKNVTPNKAGKLGKLRIQIHWDDGTTEGSNEPCSKCQELICAAEDCGLEVEICDDGEPTKQADCDKHNQKRKKFWEKKNKRS